MILVAAFPALIVAAALLYSLGMRHLEGQERDFWRSLGWAAETLTTTGYGADSSWRHPLMVVFVVGVQLTGVLLVFLLFPVYLVPFLEERFETRLPREVGRVSDHVVIYRHGPAVTMAVEEVRRAGLHAVIIEEDADVARRLHDQGETVVLRPLDDGALGAARLLAARALVANGQDAENAAAILAARQMGFHGEVLALVEDPIHRHPMALAGATGVFTPRHVLAAALAARATPRITPDPGDAERVGASIQVAEIRVDPASELASRTLAEARVGTRTGASVIGQWVQGDLRTDPGPAMRIEPRGILVAVGRDESIQQLRGLAGRRAAPRRAEGVVVAGAGVVGSKVVELLRDAGEKVRVIDQRDAHGVDVVASVFDREALVKVGVPEARAVVLALDSDAATLFATVIVRDLSTDVPVFARVNSAGNVQRIHRAGADLALSIAQVAGKILAHRLLGEEVVSIDPTLRVMRTDGGALAGSTPAELDLRGRTGCSVVLVERDEQAIAGIGPDFRFAAGDRVYVAGAEAATARFLEAFRRPG